MAEQTKEIETTQKIILPPSEDTKTDQELIDNFLSHSDEEYRQMGKEIEEERRKKKKEEKIERLKGDRDAVLNYIVDNYVTKESADILGISGNIINVNLPKLGEFSGFEGKYFISNESFELWREVFGLKRVGNHFVGWENTGLIRGNSIPDILEKCASMEEILDLAKAIQGYMKYFEIDEDIKDEGHGQSYLELSSGIGYCLSKIIGLDGQRGGYHCWLRDLSFFNRGDTKSNTFTNFYTRSGSCGFCGNYEIGDGGYLLWNLGKRSNLSTAEGLNKFGLSNEDYAIVELQNNKLV